MNGRIKAEKAVADENAQMARDAVDKYFTRVSEEQLFLQDRLKFLERRT